MININPKKVGLITLFAVVLPLIGAFIFFTRFNYVPVQLTIGECRMDYTAKPTYEDRLSPLESLDFKIKGWDMLVCYGQPSLKGRDMIGERIPYNEPWRFGANEPTRFYTTADVEIGGVFVPKVDTVCMLFQEDSIGKSLLMNRFRIGVMIYLQKYKARTLVALKLNPVTNYRKLRH